MLLKHNYHFHRVHSFAKYWPIFKILSPSDSAKKLAIGPKAIIKIKDSTTPQMHRYLVKYYNSKIALIQSVTDGVSRHVKIRFTPIWYLSIPESRSMEHIILTCCCHNSCCLPYIRSLAFLISEFLIVQQDSASAHRACETFNLLRRETPAFISPDFWSPNNPDHGPDDYQIWGISESRHKCTGCGRFEATSDWCLDWYSTKRYLQCHWVAQASPYLHSGHRRTFWILTLTH